MLPVASSTCEESRTPATLRLGFAVYVRLDRLYTRTIDRGR